MFWFNIKLTFRNLLRYKTDSILKIGGLSIGMALAILIGQYLVHEMTYDSNQKNINNIYRIIKIENDNKNKFYNACNQLPMPVLLQNYLDSNYVVGSFWGYSYAPIKAGNVQLYEYRGFSVEHEVLEIFNWDFITGDPKNALKEPNCAVLTKQFAEKLFGNANPVGLFFSLDSLFIKVTGVVENPPTNSLVSFDVLFSRNIRYNFYPDFDQRWWEGSVQVFVMNKNGAAISPLESVLKKIKNQDLSPEFREYFDFAIQPFKGVHLNDKMIGETIPPVSKGYLWTLVAIALAILLIASINYICLSTYQGNLRIKEIAVRKVAGASHKQLIMQYVVESIVVMLIVIDLALIIANLINPWFTSLLGRNIDLNFMNVYSLAVIFLFGFIVGIASSFNTAFYISRFDPQSIFHFKKQQHSKTIGNLQPFFIIQLAITLVLIISEIFITKQIGFLKNHPLGFDYKNLLSVDVSTLDRNNEKREQLIKSFLERINTSASARLCFSPASITENIPGFYFQNAFKVKSYEDVNSETREMVITSIDENYFDVFKAQLVEGIGFSNKSGKRRNRVLINETARKTLGWKTAANKHIVFHFENNPIEVIGVVKDINIQSLKYNIKPMVFQQGMNNYPAFFTIRVNPKKVLETIKFIKASWEKEFPNTPFYSFFVEDKYKDSYGEEENLSKIIGSFSFLSIILSLLGIYSFVSFTTQRRTKEIGIRKVNGASTFNIIGLLSFKLIGTIAISFIIACPITFYLINMWLKGFAYKLQPNMVIFLIGGIAVTVVILSTVFWRTFRAANRNPVESLKYE